MASQCSKKGVMYSVIRLTRLEIKKLFKNKAFYFILLALVALVILNTLGGSSNFNSHKEGIERNMQSDIASIEKGWPVLPSKDLPEWFSVAEYPLKDENGELIPENIEVWKELAIDHFQTEIDGLTTETGRFSYANLIKEAILPVVGSLLFLLVITGVILISGDYRSNSYRFMVARGIPRKHIMLAKLNTFVTVAVIFTLLATAILFVSSWVTFNSFDGGAPAVVSSTLILNVLWSLFLLCLAYLIVGGLIAIIFTSLAPSIVFSLVFVFFSFSFMDMPYTGSGFIGTLLLFTMEYNFGSIFYNLFGTAVVTTGTSAATEVIRFTGPFIADMPNSGYRDTVPAVLLVLAFIALFALVSIVIFNKKELKG